MLELNDRLSGRIQRSIRALRDFASALDQALAAHNRLRRALASPLTLGVQPAVAALRALEQQHRRMTQQLERWRTVRRGGFSPTSDDEWGTARPPSRRDRVDRFNRAVYTARNIEYLAERTFDATRGFVSPAVELLRARERFRAMGWSEREQQLAFRAVEETARAVPGVRQVDIQETLTGLVNTVGSVEDAVRLLPMASKYLANVEALYGDRFGRTEAIRQFTNTAKALELLGKDQDLQQMQRYMDIVAQAALATGGDVDPTEFRNFAKYARIAAPAMTPEGLRKFLPVIQQMGGAQAGTALMTLYSSMVGGRIPVHKLRYWDELGLIDRSKVEFSRQGTIKRLRPGAIPIADELGRDPMAVADRLAEALARKGVDLADMDAVNKQLMAMFGDRTGAGLIAQMINYRRAILKESANYERALGIEQTYKQLFEQQNALGSYLKVQAEWQNTLAQAGQAPAQLGGRVAEYLADELRRLQQQVGQHPALDAAMIGILSLGKASAEAASGVDLLGGTLRNLMGGSRGAGPGNLSGGGSWSDLAATGYVAGRGLWAAGRWLGRTGGIGALLAATGVGLSYVYQHYSKEREQRQARYEEAARAFEATRQLREQQGGRLTDEAAQQVTARVLTVMREEIPKLMPLDPDFWAETFKRRTPELQYPEVMRATIGALRQQVAAKQLTPEQYERTLQMMQQTYGATFAMAMNELNGGLQAFSSGLQTTTTALEGLPAAVDGTNRALMRFNVGLSALAGRLSSIELRPSFSLDTFGPLRPATPQPSTPTQPQPAPFVPRLPPPRNPYLREFQFKPTALRETESRRTVERVAQTVNVAINVPAGSPAALDARELARFVSYELERAMERA
ncbi:MAG: hypothetical protein IRY83_13780 [Chloroflexi bacterium]|nr:hypothetical protein [Chloroflexota bacterium]